MKKITSKDVYSSLWRCRDFELSHLWQRSIFLTTFLVMSFTGYGSMLLRVCEYITDDNKCIPFCILNIAGLCIALLGIVLSALWIMMGKGSKAWYEKYENALYHIERNEKYSKAIVANDMDDEMLMHGSLPAANPLDTSLFTTNAGRFSVSRINIAIGQVSIVVWCLAYLIQSICFSFSNQLLFILNDCGTFPWVSILSLLVWLLLLVLIIVIVKLLQKSGIRKNEVIELIYRGFI